MFKRRKDQLQTHQWRANPAHFPIGIKRKRSYVVLVVDPPTSSSTANASITGGDATSGSMISGGVQNSQFVGASGSGGISGGSGEDEEL